MDPNLKVQTTTRDEVSFNRLPSGDVEVFHVNRTGRGGGSVDHCDPPVDAKLFTIRRDQFKTMSDFFAHFA